MKELEARIRTMHEENAATTKQLLEVKAELASTKTKMNDLQERTKVVQSSPAARARGEIGIPNIRLINTMQSSQYTYVTALLCSINEALLILS